MVGSLRERLAGNRRLHCNRQPGCRRTSGELHHQPSRTAYPLSFDGTNSKTWFTARTYFYQISIQPDLPRYQHQNPNRQGHPSVTPLSIIQTLMTRRNNSILALLITGGRHNGSAGVRASGTHAGSLENIPARAEKADAWLGLEIK